MSRRGAGVVAVLAVMFTTTSPPSPGLRYGTTSQKVAPNSDCKCSPIKALRIKSA
jgi:hypothetical protein